MKEKTMTLDVTLTSMKMDIHQKARSLAKLCYRYYGSVPSLVIDILNETWPENFHAKYNPDQPRDEHGRWTSGGDSGMNIDDAVDHLNENAQSHSTGYCARYVKQAIQAGGVSLEQPYPKSAKDYGAYLERYHFDKLTPTPPPDYSPQKGDIAIIQPYSDKHPDGHIAMYNGQQWVSDFRQHDFWPGTGYRANQPPYEIYRP
jgi:hypothetical protein